MPKKRVRTPMVGGSKVIRIDGELYNYLSMFAEPLVDTPNSVMKMITGLIPQSDFFRAVRAGTDPFAKDEG